MIQIFIGAVLLGCNTGKIKASVNLCYFLCEEKTGILKKSKVLLHRLMSSRTEIILLRNQVRGDRTTAIGHATN